MTDELEAIHKRHEADDKVRQYTGFLDAPTALWAARQSHTDRATLLRLLDAERARRVEAEGALAEIARCNQYMSEADTNYEYEMRQIELCRFIKTRARATHKDTQDE